MARVLSTQLLLPALTEAWAVGTERIPLAAANSASGGEIVLDGMATQAGTVDHIEFTKNGQLLASIALDMSKDLTEGDTMTIRVSASDLAADILDLSPQRRLELAQEQERLALREELRRQQADD